MTTTLDFDALAYDSYEDAVDGLVMFRLARMMEHPENFAETRKDFFMQLELLAEFALLGMALLDEHGNALPQGLFERLVCAVPGLMRDEDAAAPVTNEWGAHACRHVSKFIVDQISIHNKIHAKTCPHCSNPSPSPHTHKGHKIGKTKKDFNTN